MFAILTWWRQTKHDPKCLGSHNLGCQTGRIEERDNGGDLQQKEGANGDWHTDIWIN